MSYILSTDQFDKNFITSNGGFIHKPATRFKLFPFTAHNETPIVLDLKNVAARFIRELEGTKQTRIDFSTIYERIVKQIKIKSCDEKLFREIIMKMFFQDEHQVRPFNLKMISIMSCDGPGEKKIADYLVDVLGQGTHRKKLSRSVTKAFEQLEHSSNVFERLFLSCLMDENSSDENLTSRATYFCVTHSFNTVFENDFLYILSDQNRVREYLIPLLEFYFFAYTAQTCLELDRFMDGERNHITPLFFCLEWEKTSKGRRSCFDKGWQMLQPCIERMFAHAITLEILNQTESETEPIDYIKLREMTTRSEDNGQAFADQINQITEYYRNRITDCKTMTDLVFEQLPTDPCAASIEYLFKCVKVQFENTKRSRAYNSYSQQFERFCNKFLKNRGRNGRMLNLSEETLIFLTKISLKDNCEKMPLKEVFKEFERRGVFLDDISKDHVAKYYEKLNLIDKKSDSGDAKYVKRIL